MNTMLAECYVKLNTWADWLRSPFLLLVRVYWGWQFIETGLGKFNNIPKVAGFFQSLGIPLPGLMAPAIAGLELMGGLLLLLGIFSRPIALLLTVNMLTAYMTADREALFSLVADPDRFYAAAPYTFLVASLIVFLAGPGRFALDRLLPFPSRARSS